VQESLPGVGNNLQDHISAAAAYSRREPRAFHRRMRLDRIVPDLARAYLFGQESLYPLVRALLFPPRKDSAATEFLDALSIGKSRTELEYAASRSFAPTD
jgi:hypothetical protein